MATDNKNISLSYPSYRTGDPVRNILLMFLAVIIVGIPEISLAQYANTQNEFSPYQSPTIFLGNVAIGTSTFNGALNVSGTITATNFSGGGTSGSGAEQTISFQPGLITAVTNTKGVFGKFVKASTVDNIEASAVLFTCTGNPTITLYECGVSSTCAASPVTIGTATVTAAGTVFDGTISSAAITAGDYVAWAISAGTCASLDVAATAQIHAN